MQTIDVQEAGAHLADLVQAAARGAAFQIAIDGNALVEVRSVTQALGAGPGPGGALSNVRDPHDIDRTLGALAGQGVLPEDFDRYMEEEILEMFGLND